MQLSDGLERLRSIGSLTAYRQLGIALDDLAQALAEQRVVVYDKYSTLLRLVFAHRISRQYGINVASFSCLPFHFQDGGQIRGTWEQTRISPVCRSRDGSLPRAQPQ